jgi:hypothetical protein
MKVVIKNLKKEAKILQYRELIEKKLAFVNLRTEHELAGTFTFSVSHG